jgi:hypothetical protein
MAACIHDKTNGSAPLRHHVLSAVRQILLIAVLYIAYRFGRMVSSGDVAEAYRNAHSVWHFERSLGLPSEDSLQRLLMQHTTVLRAANWYYVGFHFPVTVIFLAWLWLRHRAEYARARTALMLLTAAGLVVHALYPLAPPRMISSIGMVDTGLRFGPSPYAGAVGSAANQFAAMPSLHVGWAVLVAIWTIRKAPRWVGALAVAHAGITTFVVVITANHYWIDGVAGIVLVLVAVGLINRYDTGKARAQGTTDPRVDDGSSEPTADERVSVHQLQS